MLLGQAGSTLGAQQFQCGNNACTHIGCIAGQVSSAAGNCICCAAHLGGVSSSLCVGGCNDVVGSIDLFLVQDADRCAGFQCADGADEQAAVDGLVKLVSSGFAE